MSKSNIRILAEAGGGQQQSVKILKVQAEVKLYTYFSCRLLFIYEDWMKLIPSLLLQDSSLHVCMYGSLFCLTVNPSKINIIQYQ